MATTAIDTLRFARKLVQAGLPDDQAEARAAALGEELTEPLATRADSRLVQWGGRIQPGVLRGHPLAHRRCRLNDGRGQTVRD